MLRGLARLFGVARLDERRRTIETGFHWRRPGFVAVAAGRGFNQSVSGESFYRASLAKLAGPQTLYGVNISKAAVLSVVQYKGSPAVEVSIDGKRVGFIPQAEAGSLHRELLATFAGVRVTAKAQIVAGFEGGDYCVKLSLARPLKTRSS